MNAHQRRGARRLIKADHFRWPLGMLVLVRSGHHSPEAVGRIGKVCKHGYPCKDGRNCIIDFHDPVMDVTFGAARYGHYVEYRHLRKIKGTQ